MPGGVRYNCSCVPGYSFNEEGQCEKDKTVYLVVIVVVAVFLLVTALLVGFRFILKTRPDKICQRNPYSEPSDVRRVYEPIPSILNRPVNGGGAIDYTIESNNATNNEPNNEPEKRILIISTEETEEHRDVIYKFAVFLKEYAGLLPIIPSQHTNDIHKLTLETWLCNENRQAFKVLFICSLGMLDRWVREREGDPNPNRGIPVESEFGDLFIQMKHITSTERRKLGTLQKFAVAYFSDYFSKRMVDDIELFRGMPCYNLMADVETLCFRLNGIEQNTPTSSRRMPQVKEYERVEEGQALLRAIRVMKSRHGIAAPTLGTLRQFSQVSTDSDRTPTPERSVSPHYELNSQEGSENSVAFQPITEGAQKEMASVSGFFSNSYSDSDDESSSNSGTHQVDVHRHSGDDSGFTLAQPDYRPVAAVPSKPDDYSLNGLDSGLSSLPISPLSSREDSDPMTGHLASLDASGHIQPMPIKRHAWMPVLFMSQQNLMNIP
ncbi:uncharacterized protein LOC100890352 isoform X3 [Strongylocentrotus purpuratus]|uniref:EGF-like domain-containing protein n=1 Tax=Strongylocentrotus purpuratus TaxID=7668 RepID=A0A7M7MX12_STRPU|nr:uncharacterized protein LOC100890352 isoform X3 [Strongylocentrotus purpuratus]